MVGRNSDQKVIFSMNEDNGNVFATITQYKCEVLESRPKNNSNEGVTEEWWQLINNKFKHNKQEEEKKGVYSYGAANYDYVDSSENDDSNEAIAPEDDLIDMIPETSFKTPDSKEKRTEGTITTVPEQLVHHPIEELRKAS